MKLRLAFLFSLIAIGIHCYLTLHFYQLNFGLLEGASVCNISARFNCDAVTASSFASILGVPVALWGAVTTGILAVLLLVWNLQWSEDLPRLGRYSLWLSGFIALTSIIMGCIATFYIRSECIFCMSEYLISFVNFGLIWASQEPDSRPFGTYIVELFGPARNYLALIVALPVAGFLLNYSFLNHYGATELPEVVHDTVLDWQSAPKVVLNTPPLLTKGSKKPIMTLAEFADFRCPHCRHAVGAVDAFIASHPDVKLKFYAFPLDNTCNEAVSSGDGISCYLARTVYCVQKLNHLGWALHHYIYNHQILIDTVGTMSYAQGQIGDFLKIHKVDPQYFSACVNGNKADEAIRAQAQLGAEIGVKGTPTFFVNGRMLTRGSLIPVLDAVHSALEKSKL